MLENILSIVPMASYLYLNDRMQADILAGAVYLAILGCVLIFACRFIIHRIVEPAAIKKMVETKRREQNHINRFTADMA